MFNIQYLKAILAIQSFSKKDEAMQDFLYKEINAIPGVKIYNDDYGNIYGVKGEGVGVDKFYPCVVAHIDTVHHHIDPKDFNVVEVAGTVFGWDSSLNKMHGIGGDDKVGIYMVLQLLKDQPNIKFALFRDEEIGCVGSSNAHMPFFDNVTFVLQADRRGLGDWITRSNGADLQSDEFLLAAKDILNEHDYKEAHGTSTDVGQLKKNKLPVCCANVGCGYYNAHQASEYIVLSETEICFNLFVDFFNKMTTQRWLHEYTPYVYTAPASNYGTYLPGYDWRKHHPEIASKIENKTNAKVVGLPGINTNGSVKKKTKQRGKKAFQMR